MTPGGGPREETLEPGERVETMRWECRAPGPCMPGEELLGREECMEEMPEKKSEGWKRTMPFWMSRLRLARRILAFSSSMEP